MWDFSALGSLGPRLDESESGQLCILFCSHVWNAMAGVGMQLPCKCTMNTINLSTDGFSTKEVKKPSVLNGIHRALARQLHTNTCHRIPDSGTKKYTQLTRLTFVESGAKTRHWAVRLAPFLEEW